jgi:hypothetical protein
MVNVFVELNDFYNFEYVTIRTLALILGPFYCQIHFLNQISAKTLDLKFEFNFFTVEI